MSTSLLYITIFIISFSSMVYGQSKYFEGKIVSKITFEIKDSTSYTIALSKMMESSSVKYFKEGNSFEILDKGDIKTYLYVQSENKVYLNKWSKDTLYVNDCSGKGKELTKIKLTNNADNVLGLPCDKLQITYLGGTNSYYFNKTKAKINPTWYSRMTCTNWDKISEIIQSVVLKEVIERDGFRITMVVTSLSEEKVADEIFKIPLKTILIDDK